MKFRPCRELQLLLHSISHGVFHAANGVLHFPFDLVGFALLLQLSITDGLADRLLYVTFNFLRRSGDAIFVHNCFLQHLAKPSYREKSAMR